MATLRRNQDVELHYYDDDFTEPWRAAPTMLLQHGFSRSGKFWYNWVPLLAHEFRILRPDMRGMGESTITEDGYDPSLDIFVDDLLSILDHLGVDKVVYVGESFGGIIGLKFAHTPTHRIRSLVFCNTPCRLPRREPSGSAGDLDSAMGGSIGAWSTATIDRRLDTRVAPKGMKEWYIAEMDRVPPSIGRRLQGYLETLDFSQQLKEVKTPTLLLTGAESLSSTLDQQQFMSEQLPNSRLVVYPGLGHGINAIYPEWCTQQVREFVALRSAH